jgi:hypothetical protein
MALSALARYYAGMTERDNTPRRGRGVALLAPLSRRDVIRGLESACLNAAALGVTGYAILGRPLEGTLNVAGLAGDRDVRSGQRETRFEVVKTYLTSCGCRQRVAIRQCEQEKAQDCQGSDPERRSAEINCVLHSQVLNPDNLMNRRTTDSRANFLE